MTSNAQSIPQKGLKITSDALPFEALDNVSPVTELGRQCGF